MKLQNLLTHKKEIIKLANTHGASNLRVFGSIARGEADQKSDVDLIVDLKKDSTLLNLGALLMDLEDLLHCKVDLVTEKALNPRIKDKVLKEAISL